jgi:hypothetical protein
VSEEKTGGQTTPLGEDWPAIAAHAAHHDIVAPAEALASWRALNEDRRIAWRASADAVRMLLDATAGAAPAHERLLEAILLNADEDLNADDATPGEHEAVHYVRWLETERSRLAALSDEEVSAYTELAAEVNEQRELVAEILDAVEATTDRAGMRVQLAKWHKRAGLAEPAVATSGTEHLAAEIARLPIPPFGSNPGDNLSVDEAADQRAGLEG